MTSMIIITLLATNWIAISAYMLLLCRYRKAKAQLMIEKESNSIIRSWNDN